MSHDSMWSPATRRLGIYVVFLLAVVLGLTAATPNDRASSLDGGTTAYLDQGNAAEMDDAPDADELLGNRLMEYHEDSLEAAHQPLWSNSKRAWNSGFGGGMGKRAWNSGFFAGGVGKRAWNSGFIAGGVGKRTTFKTDDGVESDELSDEVVDRKDKRNWNNVGVRGTWGKRDNQQPFSYILVTPAWIQEQMDKRTSNWSGLSGMWGRRKREAVPFN